MAKKSDVDQVQEEYNLIYTRCEGFCNELTRQIASLISKSDIRLAVPIQNRTKNWSSILDKIQGRFTIKKSLFEMQDLVGLRIILLFKRDVITTANLVKENFKIIDEYNTEDKLDDNQFGYSSIHQIIELNNEWLKVPTLKEYANIKAEIQIRTLSQHAWAEASNIFQYKNENNVPKPLKRAISRISALLETVDFEFERVLEERRAYKNEIIEIKEDIGHQRLLDVDMLAQILNERLPEQNKSKHEDYSDLLENLDALNLNTSGQLIALINKNLEKTLEEDKRVKNLTLKQYSEGSLFDSPGSEDGDFERVRKGVYFTHAGLIRTMIGIEYGKPYWELINEKNNGKPEENK